MWINVQTYAAQLWLRALQMLPENSVLYHSASVVSSLTNITLLNLQLRNRKGLASPWKKKWRTESRLCFGFPVCGPEAGNRSYIDNMDPSVRLVVKCLFFFTQHRLLQCGDKTRSLYHSCEWHAFTKIKLSYLRWSTTQSVMNWLPLLDEDAQSSWETNEGFPHHFLTNVGLSPWSLVLSRQCQFLCACWQLSFTKKRERKKPWCPSQLKGHWLAVENSNLK